MNGTCFRMKPAPFRKGVKCPIQLVFIPSISEEAAPNGDKDKERRNLLLAPTRYCIGVGQINLDGFDPPPLGNMFLMEALRPRWKGDGDTPFFGQFRVAPCRERSVQSLDSSCNGWIKITRL